MDLRRFFDWLCTDRGINKSELCFVIGWTPQQLSNIVTRNKLSLKACGKLAKYLGCEISDIPGSRLFDDGRDDEEVFEKLKSVKNFQTHKSFLTFKCPCCGKKVRISALCVFDDDD